MSTESVTTSVSHPRRPFPMKIFLLWVGMLPVVFVLIMPVWYMVSKAFTPEINQIKWPIYWLPDPFTLENFNHIIQDKTLPVMRWLFNSFLVTGVGTAAVLFLSALSAFGFARLEFPGRDTIFFILLISLMVPSVATLIPTFLLLRDMKLLDNYFALWLPAGASVGAIFFMRQQFYAVPHELEDAAVVDGAGTFRVFWQICLPLVRSALVAQAILTGLAFWNDLYWPLIVLNTRDLLTMPVGLLVIQQGSYVQRGLAFAGAFLGTTPPLILYAIFQRQIIQGMATAGLAGR